jgi:hypothetical protein
VGRVGALTVGRLKAGQAPKGWVRRSMVSDRCPACGRVKVLSHTSLEKLVQLHVAEIDAHARKGPKGGELARPLEPWPKERTSPRTRSQNVA